MTKERPQGQSKREFDLEERTAAFAEAVIRFARKLPSGPVVLPLIGQFVRSGTSIAANYCEADDAESKKDFVDKIAVCRKEARETKFWLRAIAAASPEAKDEARVLWRQARELHLIFASIWRSSKGLTYDLVIGHSFVISH